MQIYIELKLPSGNTTIFGEGGTLQDIYEYNKELTFEYIFGTKFSGNEPINNDFIVEFENPASTYQIKASNSEIIGSGLKPSKNGLRGLANPASITKDEEYNEYLISTTGLLNPWEKNNLGQKWKNQNTGKNIVMNMIQANMKLCMIDQIYIQIIFFIRIWLQK